jgi:peptidoglycan/xylan/chitin deacetylase (PgdA/CDA1 family)
MKNLLFIAAVLVFVLDSCGANDQTPAEKTSVTSTPQNDSGVVIVPVSVDALSSGKARTAAEIMSTKQVPILCYHRIREFKANDSRSAKDYIVPPDHFREQMKLLADSGYKTILPDQLVDHLQFGTPIPDKSVMLTFDDNVLDQMEVAKPVLDQYGFKGVFFIMTVTMNKPGYMSRDQIKQLYDAGHVIGSHTYDHQNMKKLPVEEWVKQIDKPQTQLKEITGKEIKYFAYPFGLWKPENIPGLQQRGIRAAFELTEKRDSLQPMYTIRRMIVPGDWTAERMFKTMKGSFERH